MAAVAVCAHVVGVANQVSAFTMAFFTSDTAGDCVFLEFFRVMLPKGLQEKLINKRTGRENF